ncbi:hypothetical protein BTVI_38077 [Pitangus sulphuratus]|nr:hypothetical protein BTVI_38077 [Pitangus sulphuratus]
MYRLGNERLESSTDERDLGGLVSGKLGMSQQCPGSQDGPPCPGGHQAKHRHPVEGGDGPSLLCTGGPHPVRPPTNIVAVLGSTKGAEVLESIQSSFLRIVNGLEGKPHEESLKSLGLFSLEKRRLRGNFTAVFDILMRENRGAGTDLFTLVTSDRTQGNGMKLSQRRFRLDIRKQFFPQREVGHWNRPPREVVTASNLTEFKKCLDNDLRNMV